MKSQIVKIPATQWQLPATDPNWIDALEQGKVLYFPTLPFTLTADEQTLLTPEVLEENVRNISLAADNQLKGAAGDERTQILLTKMFKRYRTQAEQLVHSLLPKYQGALRSAPTSYRPKKVEARKQSWRADDRRMHVDAFPSRPNRGERILRVFSNINPEGVPRVWRVGEPFAEMVETMLPRAKPYVRWQAKALNKLGITKSLRSEYDHLMLQLHDNMKADMQYQQEAKQVRMPFTPNSVWVCFSDHALHGVESGQYMMEQTFHIAPEKQYDPSISPLAHLTEVMQRKLV